MSKRLKTLIFISSFFVVALILGVVLIGLIGNISTIQVNDFRIYESTNVFSASSGVEQVDVYLSNSKLSKKQSILSDYTAENYVLSVDNSEVCSVSKENGANILTAKAVGSTFVRVKDKVLSAQNSYTETEVKVVQINVYAEMTTITLNLLSSEINRLPFVLKTQANSGGISIAFASSDPTVAKMVSEDGNFFVEYYKAGVATLSIYCVDNPSLKDTVIVNVVDKEPDDLYFVDESGTKIDRKTMYADGSYYTINYELLFGSKRASEIGGINGENIRVLDTGIKSLTLIDYKTEYIGTNGEARYRYAIDSETTKTYAVAPFDNSDAETGAGVVLDKANRCLKLKKTYRPEDNITGTGDEEKQLKDVFVIVTLQTYTNIDGVEVITGTYQIPVYIYRKIVIDIEVEVAGRPQDFKDASKHVVNYHESDKVWGNLSWKGKTIKSVENLYMTEADNNVVRTLYIKVYRVYNNGEREQINSSNSGFNTVNSSSSGDNLESRMYTAPDMSFTAIKIEKCGVSKGSKETILTIVDSGLTFELKVTFDTIDNINKGIDLKEDETGYKQEGTYVYNQERKTYEFTYFDERMRSDLEYTNSVGNIIAIRKDNT